ncbi:MAG TPA: alpha/beta hydrolase family protein [Terriglobales bacterium]|nr:alpha/beta hydrolase family protein [Terriglobales bacterium]
MIAFPKALWRSPHGRDARAYIARLLLLLAVLLLPGCSKQNPRPDHPRLTPKVTLIDVTFHSAALSRDVPYRVILPAAPLAGRKLPVVYLLHGGGADFHSWSNDSDVARFAEDGLILVMPEGASSYYTNAAERAADRYEDYVVKDLIADVESRFPAATGRENRAVAGVSMGGFGAVKLALKHPELYAFAGGISSALDVPSRPFSIKRMRQYLGHRAIFGPWGGETRRENDPFVLIQSADPEKVPFLFLTCGEQEGLLPANRRFATLLGRRHFRYEFHTMRGGHDWNQWNEWLSACFASLEQHIGGKS